MTKPPGTGRPSAGSRAREAPLPPATASWRSRASARGRTYSFADMPCLLPSSIVTALDLDPGSRCEHRRRELDQSVRTHRHRLPVEQGARLHRRGLPRWPAEHRRVRCGKRRNRGAHARRHWLPVWICDQTLDHHARAPAGWTPIVGVVTGFNSDELTGPGRGRAISFARALAMHLLRSEAGLRSSDATTLMHRDVATVHDVTRFISSGSRHNSRLHQDDEAKALLRAQ